MKDLFNILVPTDYSEESMPALEYALSISEKFSATIYILHSYQLPVYPQEMPSEPSGIELQGVEDEAEAKMNDLIKGLQAKHEKATIISLVNYGEVETMIDELVEEKNIDLLILSSKGGNAAKAMLFGSICADSIGKVKCPIIIVPKGFKVSDTKNIAYAANWIEEDDIKGIKNLLPWAKAFDAKITVVHIYTSNESYSKRDRHEYEAKLHESVDGAALEVALLKGADFSHSMEEFVRKENIDLLVMITHPRFFLEGLYHPSFTKRILRHIDVPLLVFYNENL